jgi:PAS domain S-box-containing protein
MNQARSTATSRLLVAEKETAEQELRHQIQIMDHIKDAVLSTDLNGMVRSWNRGAQLHFGYTAAQAIGRHI